MKTTYLNDFDSFTKNGTAYIPVGTIEWHGNHLPVETDIMIAQKICELISKKVPGYVLPPFYLGTDRTRQKNGKKFTGMNWYLEKQLSGNLYYLKPGTLYKVISELSQNLVNQGFRRIFIITGHAGSKHVEVLEKVDRNIPKVKFINPYISLSVHAHHADEYETSLLWAFYPEEEKKSKAIKIPKDDDYSQFMGYDLRQKASLKIGKKMIGEIIESCVKQIQSFK